jgi:hypothetical protein
MLVPEPARLDAFFSASLWGSARWTSGRRWICGCIDRRSARPISAAALARTPAIHPVEAVFPASWHSSTVAR